MRNIRTAVFASIAALAVLGAAVAASNDNHVMKLDLPDGSIARIDYQGDVAPKVTVTPALNFVPVHGIDPFAAAAFPMIDRIAAVINRQTDMMMQQVRSAELPSTAGDGEIDFAAFKAMPAGTVSYSFVSTASGQGICSQGVQITSFGPGQQPKVVSTSSGSCRDMPAASTQTGWGAQDENGTLTALRTAASHDGEPLHTT